MLLIKNSIHQIKILFPVLALSYLAIFVVLLCVALISVHFNIPAEKFTRDPTYLLDGHPLIGVLSNIGILFWCSAAAICFFTSVVYGKNRNTLFAKFLVFSGLLTTFLLVDDFFLIHESIFPNFFHIPETAFYLGYLLLVTTYFVKFRGVINQTEFTIILIACSFLGVSVISDVVLPQSGWSVLIEDGFKLFGIVTWFIYFVRTCYIQTKEIVS